MPPKTARKLKRTPGSSSESVRSPNPPTRMPNNTSPASEKKCSSKVSELESLVAHLQEELKKAKDQLNSSESSKKWAQQEAEAAKYQLGAMSDKLEDSRNHLIELSASEEARILELRKLSQERDRAWESELEALQKQHTMDSSALAFANNEISNLKFELKESLSLVGMLKSQIKDFEESEEALRLEGLKAIDDYNSMAAELEQSKSRITSLEQLVGKLEGNLGNGCHENSVDDSCDAEGVKKNGEKEDVDNLKKELDRVTCEVERLKAALDMSERQYQEEYIQSTFEIRRAYELVECSKSESKIREAELESKLKDAKANIEELKASLMAKETELQSISVVNESMIEEKKASNGISEMEMEGKNVEADMTDLKARLLDKETELQCLSEENKMLKLEIEKREMEGNKANDDSATLAESEMEAELRRLKVQSDQWRKAAEAAAAMLSTDQKKVKFADIRRVPIIDGNYNNTLAGKLGSPFSEDIDEESPIKKNGNMLKKIGVLLKKGQK